ncbi:hypothetical protein [Sediminispirochaeta smaragdinae]|uniref:CD-NTase associated protein 4-like DNA endonuclease domain-containing protein n=1 Tax=Sediminispirochaeta smaragdinae (strain DSM 11293 / JCM 15392 / SEBR 4228) TaxID=573413 RepID=E1RA47_SEDSS|nr:hypothetical protein [Sediminispirochaeta smaragdinae]ADK83366.1 hypothetical protein Spirs_4293 [Sediminispirochaeta smaragdinae DSM 11293]
MPNVSPNNQKVDDASHVYRGYRKQLLFVLYKILTEGKTNIFCPEGIEDFSVINNGEVKSIYQVKDYSDPIVISDLSSNKPNSFVKRVINYIKEYPEALVSLSYFGKLGPELQRISEKDENTIRTVALKISTKEKISIDNAEGFLHKVCFQQLSESELKRNSKEILSSSKLGLDTENSTDLLLWWLFRESLNSLCEIHTIMESRFTEDSIFVGAYKELITHYMLSPDLRTVFNKE